jgi:hypothetical protein
MQNRKKTGINNFIHGEKDRDNFNSSSDTLKGQAICKREPGDNTVYRCHIIISKSCETVPLKRRRKKQSRRNQE